MAILKGFFSDPRTLYNFYKPGLLAGSRARSPGGGLGGQRPPKRWRRFVFSWGPPSKTKNILPKNKTFGQNFRSKLSVKTFGQNVSVKTYWDLNPIQFLLRQVPKKNPEDQSSGHFKGFFSDPRTLYNFYKPGLLAGSRARSPGGGLGGQRPPKRWRRFVFSWGPPSKTKNILPKNKTFGQNFRSKLSVKTYWDLNPIQFL